MNIKPLVENWYTCVKIIVPGTSTCVPIVVFIVTSKL